MIRLAFAAALSLALLACSPSAPRTAENTRIVRGTIVQRLDSPPYSFLRLELDSGETWAAVPLASVRAGERIEIQNGVTLKSYEAKSLGKRFDSVVFGTLSSR